MTENKVLPLVAKKKPDDEVTNAMDPITTAEFEQIELANKQKQERLARERRANNGVIISGLTKRKGKGK